MTKVEFLLALIVVVQFIIQRRTIQRLSEQLDRCWNYTFDLNDKINDHVEGRVSEKRIVMPMVKVNEFHWSNVPDEAAKRKMAALRAEDAAYEAKRKAIILEG